MVPFCTILSSGTYIFSLGRGGRPELYGFALLYREIQKCYRHIFFPRLYLIWIHRKTINTDPDFDANVFLFYLPASSPERLLASTCMMAVREGVLTGPPPTCSTAAKAGVAHPPHAGFVSTGEAAGPVTVSASGTEASFFLSFCESLGNFFIGVSGLLGVDEGALVVIAAEGSVVGVGVWAEGWSAARMALKKDLSLDEILQTFTHIIIHIPEKDCR